VSDVATDICRHFGLAPETSVVCVRDRAFNDQRYFIGSGKLTALGWKQRTSWEDGLRKTIDWYLKLPSDRYWCGDVESALQPHPTPPPTPFA